MDEKRTFRRFSMNLPAQYQILDSAEAPFVATILNISPQGLCFHAKDPVEPFQTVVLSIELEGRQVQLKVKVIWSQGSTSTEDSKLGVQIIDPKTMDAKVFMEYYCDKILVFPEDVRKRILIMEAEKDLSDLLVVELANEDYDVLCAIDGEEGYAQYLSLRPDLVILDWELPKLNGREVCQKIRTENGDNHTPVLMLAPEGESEEQTRAEGLGIQKYISKPFDRKILLANIRALLGE